MCHIYNFSLFLLGSLTMKHGDRHQNSVSNWLRSKDIAHNIILQLSLVAILFLTSKKNSSRMPSWHPPDSDSGMVQDDESTIKFHNNAKTRFSWIWPFGIWTITRAYERSNFSNQVPASFSKMLAVKRDLPCSRIRHIETVMRQPLQISHRHVM